MGEEDSKIRNQEVMELLDYGFNNYRMDLLKSKDEVVKTMPLDKASKSKVSFVPVSDIGILSKVSDQKKKYTYDVKLDKFSLPVVPGDVVGKVIVKSQNNKVTSVDLTVSEKVEVLSFWQLLGRGFKDLMSGNFTFNL